MATRECYIAMLEMEEHQQTMCIREQWTTAESVEELEEIVLDESRPRWTTRIGTLASPMIRQDLAVFLRMNQDRKSTRLNSSHLRRSRMPSSA